MVVVKAVSRVTILLFISVTWQLQPFCASGNKIVPVVAVPPVPTLIWNAAVPLLITTEGEVPKPEIVGDVLEINKLFGPNAGIEHKVLVQVSTGFVKEKPPLDVDGTI